LLILRRKAKNFKVMRLATLVPARKMFLLHAAPAVQRYFGEAKGPLQPHMGYQKNLKVFDGP
jgi:hypothetical protein